MCFEVANIKDHYPDHVTDNEWTPYGRIKTSSTMFHIFWKGLFFIVRSFHYVGNWHSEIKLLWRWLKTLSSGELLPFVLGCFKQVQCQQRRCRDTWQRVQHCIVGPYNLNSAKDRFRFLLLKCWIGRISTRYDYNIINIWVRCWYNRVTYWFDIVKI